MMLVAVAVVLLVPAAAVVGAMVVGTETATAVLLAVGVLALPWLLLKLVRADADVCLLTLPNHASLAFQDKVVWITGGSRGLGLSLAKHFAAHGAKLVLSSRSMQSLQAAQSALQEQFGDTHVMLLPFDLSASYLQLQRAAQAAETAFGSAGIDILVHCAGASQHALAAETTSDITEQLLQLNLRAPILLSRAVLPHMLERRRGHLVLVASMAARVPSPGQSSYSAAKAGAASYFLTLASELADTGVEVTVACPGPIGAASDDDMRTVYGANGLITRSGASAGSAGVPLQRCTQHIANAIAHRVTECWIARHPVLAIGHVMQYMPALGWRVLKKVGPRRAAAVKSGKGGYNVSEMLKPKAPS